jgi:hypothetical protein
MIALLLKGVDNYLGSVRACPGLVSLNFFLVELMGIFSLSHILDSEKRKRIREFFCYREY